MKNRTHRAWSVAHDARLRQLFAEKRSLRSIGSVLGRDHSGVRKRLIALNLYMSTKRTPRPVPALVRRKDLPELQTRRRNNAVAEARFAKLMHGRLFGSRESNDWGGMRLPRPDPVATGSSMSWAAA